jgi:hypothetical protein
MNLVIWAGGAQSPRSNFTSVFSGAAPSHSAGFALRTLSSPPGRSVRDCYFSKGHQKALSLAMCGWKTYGWKGVRPLGHCALEVAGGGGSPSPHKSITQPLSSMNSVSRAVLSPGTFHSWRLWHTMGLDSCGWQLLSCAESFCGLHDVSVTSALCLTFLSHVFICDPRSLPYSTFLPYFSQVWSRRLWSHSQATQKSKSAQPSLGVKYSSSSCIITMTLYQIKGG